jgi:alkylation response protein AidB-like acyl-CoA dehydrogenase
MNFEYTKAQLELQDEISHFVKHSINKLGFIDEKRPFNAEEWKEVGKIKIQGLPIPEEFGGRGVNALSTAIALEELSYHCEDGGLPFAIAAQMLSCLIPIWKFGSETQKGELLPKLCDGSSMIANSITESEVGSDIYGMKSIAKQVGDYFIINAQKTLITNAPIANWSLIYVATDSEKRYFGGISAFLINHNLGGVNSNQNLKKIGLESVQMGNQNFDNVRVSEKDLLGKLGAGGPIFQYSMEWERACLGAVHLGRMKKILDFLIQFVKNRNVGGNPIGKYQSIAHKIADMKVKIETSRLILYKAASHIDLNKETGISASIAKLYISEAYRQMCYDAFSVMGGSAYLSGSFIENYLKDSLSSTIYSGTSEIQRNIISKYLKI